MMLINPDKGKDILLKNGIFYLLALLMAFGLKYHYSHASSDDLVWILGPTAELVENVCGISFEKEKNTGFVNQGQRIIIAPSCAGINFLIIAFCMTVFSCLHHFRRRRLKLLCLGISALSSYLLGVAVNTVRIIVSIHLYETDINNSWLTPERVHRIGGITIYFFFLCMFYLIIRIILNHYGLEVAGNKETVSGKNLKKSNYAHPASTGLVPLFWYFVIVLVIPLINAAYRKNVPRFLEHCCMVISVCFAVFVLVILIQLCCRRISGSIN